MKLRHRALLKQDVAAISSIGAAYAATLGLCLSVMGPVSLAGACILSGVAFCAGTILRQNYERDLSQKFSPETGRLRAILDKVLLKAGHKEDVGLYTEFSDELPNALAMGKNITVSDSLGKMLDDAEIEAVLSHEVGHIIEKDNDKIPNVVLPKIFSAVAFGSSVVQAGYAVAVNQDDAGSLIVKSAVALATVFAVHALTQRTCRAWEYRADVHSALITGRPDTLISVLDKLEDIRISDERMSGRRGMPLPEESLWSRYPYLKNRISALQDIRL